MSDMTLFEGGNSLASSDLFKQLQDTDDNLSGGTGGGGARRTVTYTYLTLPTPPHM